MSKILTLARRELAGYFLSPMAYVIGALFMLSSALWFFHRVFVPLQEASLRPLFDIMAYIMVFIAPLLTMRLLSEEYDSGTVETLLTAPVTDAQVICGKFLGVMGFYLALLAGTVVFLLLMVRFAQPDPGVAAMGDLGMVLLGAAYLAVGVFASTLTRYQLIAAIVGAAILAVFAILMQLLVAYAGAPVNTIASRLNAMTYFKDFSRGVFDTRGAVFFVTTAGGFLFLSVKALESRRWR